MMDGRLKKLKDEVYKANMMLVENDLVIGTFGNVSGIDRESGTVAIKPSGVDYGSLSPSDIVLIGLDGNIIDGKLNPSSDTKTHLKLYRVFPDIGGVAHTHSRFATAWAQAKMSIPCLGTTHADYFYGEVPCTGIISDRCIKDDYEAETGSLIVDTFKNIDYHSMKAVVVACHGPFSWGDDAGDAANTSVYLEETAHIAYLSTLLDSSLGNIKRSLLDKHYLRKHGKDAYYGQSKGE